MGSVLRRTAPSIVLALAGVTLVAGAARSQTEVSGGGSFEEAPVLESGTYTDTIRSGETLFFGLDLNPRDRMRVRVSIESPGNHPPAEVHVRAYDARRREDPFAHEPGLIRDRAIKLTTATSPVGSDNPDYPEPGRHFVALSIGSLPSPRGFDVTMSVAVEAVPRPDEPAPAPENGSEAEPEPGHAGLYASSLLGGAVLGFLAVTVRRALRPARRLKQGF